MTHHDPTVTAAVVTVVGTVVGTSAIAIGGFITTLKTARRALESAEKTSREALEASESNVRQTIQGEREHRLWERRTDGYLDILAFVTHRGVVRKHQARQLKWDEKTEQAIETTLDSYVPRGTWFDLEARLRAYATEAVIRAVLETNTAHQGFVSAAMAIQFATAGDASLAAFKARDKAVQVADAKDTALVELIRDEIQRMR